MTLDIKGRTGCLVALFTLAAAALGACAAEDPSTMELGGVGSGGANGATDQPPIGIESDLSLPRLSHDEYSATLTDVVTELAPTLARDVLPAVLDAASALPRDQRVAPAGDKHGGFSRVDQAQQQLYADVPFQVATQLGKALTSTPSRLASLVGACANGASVDRACLESFVKRLGELALRRPLADEDVAFYTAPAPATGASADVIAEIVTRMFSSPRFLYHVESGTDATAGAPDIFALDAWELASRLSFHFWGTSPDAKLREAARSGALLTPDGYAAEVDRLFRDPRATATFEAFFTEWFWPLLDLPALDSRSADPTFKAFAGANAPSTQLRGSMVKEVLDAATFIATHGGSLADLLTNRQSFARDPELSAIYGVAPWNGASAPPELPAVRVGLLTRAAFLSTGTANTRPIMKGVFIRSTLLCDEIPPPPAAVSATVELSPTASTRQVVEQITGTGGCAGCHNSSINPLGFATENFDALGRARTTQALYDAAGKVSGQATVDTTSVPRITPGDARTSRGIGDVTAWLVESGKVEACFARRYFRFTYRRLESTSGDTALIDVFTRSAREGKPLGDLLRATALRPEFKRRRFVK